MRHFQFTLASIPEVAPKISATVPPSRKTGKLNTIAARTSQVLFLVIVPEGDRAQFFRSVLTCSMIA